MGLKMFGVTEIHNGEPEKDNEDCFYTNSETGVALVGDGVTRMRRKDRIYPRSEGLIAPRIFGRVIPEILKAENDFSRPWRTMRKAFKNANEALRKENEKLGLMSLKCKDFFHNDYFSVVGAVLWFPPELNYGLHAFIGDCLCFYVAQNGNTYLLTRNQGGAWSRFYEKHFFQGRAFKENERSEANARRLAWEKSEIRNKEIALLPNNLGAIEGFGALTGELEALKFVEINIVKAWPGDRFILLTDGVRAFGRDEEIKGFIRTLRRFEAKDFAKTVVDATRMREYLNDRRSDDFTIVIIDV